MPIPDKQSSGGKWINIAWSLGSAAALVFFGLIQAISVGNTKAVFLGFMLPWMALLGAITGPAMRRHIIIEEQEDDSDTPGNSG